jgi:protein tyrosine phosphatase (PTP) superfamily phosphohydrolase (DUF442 family)
MLRLLCLSATLLLTSCGAPDPTSTAPDSAGAAGGAVPALGIRNLTRPLPNVLCSGQPTEAQFDQLQAAGVTHVLHLRVKSEGGTGWEEDRAAAADVSFERLEIAGGKGLTRANVEAFAAKLDSYGDDLVLVSCASSNRVGAMLALKACWLDGMGKADAMALGKRGGMKSLTDAVDGLLGP